MIDSSGRRALRANGTLLDIMPIGQVVSIIAGLLVALFVIVKPEASYDLGATGRLVFWSLHVGLGLAALWVVGRWLASRAWLPSVPLLAVLMTGGAAVILALPGYVLLDRLFDPYLVDLNGPIVQGGWLSTYGGEALELAPWFIITWMLINLPILLPGPGFTAHLDDSVIRLPASASVSTPAATPAATPAGKSTSDHGEQLASQGAGRREPVVLLHLVSPDRVGVTQPEVSAGPGRFLASLPGVVGTDLVAVSSDLHYLNVWTVAGRTTVLGRLRDVVDELGDSGMQIHRSHWVSHAHVRRIVGTYQNAAVILSNELRLPVSRRRWNAVRDQYGRGVLHLRGAVTDQARADSERR